METPWGGTPPSVLWHGGADGGASCSNQSSPNASKAGNLEQANSAPQHEAAPCSPITALHQIRVIAGGSLDMLTDSC